MKKFVYFCFAIVMFSCNSAKNAQHMSPILIAEGNLYGSGSEGLSKANMVIHNQTEWKELIAKMNATNETVKKDQMNAVDFDNQMVIALIDQQRTKGGHSIKISGVENKKESVVVNIQKSQPEGMTTMVMTQPYYLATIPKTKKEIVFEEVE